MSVPDDPTEILEGDSGSGERRVPTLRTLALGGIAALLVAALPAALEPTPLVGRVAAAGSLGLVALSVPGGALGWRLVRERGAQQLRPALSAAFVGALLADVLAAAGGLVVLSLGFRPALALGGAVGALLLLWVALPLTVGAYAASRQFAPVRYAVAAWPVTSVLGLLVAAAGTGDPLSPGGSVPGALVVPVVAVVVAGPAAVLSALVWARRRG